MKKLILLFFISLSSITANGQDDNELENYNPLTQFVGTWKADVIRTIKGEERIFPIFYKAKFMDTGTGLTITFYSATEDGKIGAPWLDVAYFYNKENGIIYSMGGLSSGSVDISEATVDEKGNIQIIVRKAGKDLGSYNLNTWEFPSDNEIIFKSTSWDNYKKLDKSAYARAERVME